MLRSKCGGAGQSLDSKKNVDLSSLPPPRVCLKEHIKRVNYQVAIWKRGHIPKPEIPHPADDHGWMMSDGRLEPRWFKGKALPASLADIFEKTTEEETAEDSDSSDDDFDSDGDICDNESDGSDSE